MTKFCPTCGVTKPVEEFSKNRAKADGLATACRSCKKLVQSRWYSANRTRHMKNVKAYGRAQRRELTLLLLEYLSEHPCVDCGEGDPLVLDFDHVRGRKEHNISAMMSNKGCSWISIQAEIAKCVVRCANCHRRKTAHERNTLRFQLLNGGS